MAERARVRVSGGSGSIGERIERVRGRVRDEGEMRTSLVLLILARTASRRWQGSVGGVLLAGRKKKERKDFCRKPPGLFCNY